MSKWHGATLLNGGYITDPHQRYYQILEYGDAEGYQARVQQFREHLREDDAARTAAETAP